jgi:pimeloyl-ACP methyl ester carboxylesterase
LSKDARKHTEDLRAASRLLVEATKAVTDVVQEMHRTIGSGPPILGSPFAIPMRALTGIVYAPIRGVTNLVGAGLDAALEQLAPLLGESVPGPDRDAMIGIINGVLGDYLHESKNPLATEMALRQGGKALPLDAAELKSAIPDAKNKIIVLVHGSSMTDRLWLRSGHDHGAALARDLGYTPIYLHYNSGLHISTNGCAFAHLLDQITKVWPVDIERIDILGHSMGGLVSRSALHIAEQENLGWIHKVKKFVALGSPHHGSPLERSGNWLDALLGFTSYTAPLRRLAHIRSAGVTDMRFGNVLDEHWAGQDRFGTQGDLRSNLTLPAGIESYAIAATTSKSMTDKLAGDGLVQVESALGKHERADLTLPFPDDHQWIALGTGHMELLNRPEVYAQLKKWFAA